MADREERRFVEVSRDSVNLMAESAGVELGDDAAALLAEDVCYRLREAAQSGCGAYWASLQAVLDDDSVSNAQVKADGHKVYGAILLSAAPTRTLSVAVECLLKMKAVSVSACRRGLNKSWTLIEF